MKDFFSFLAGLFSFNQKQPLDFTQFAFWTFFLLVYAGFCLTQSNRINKYLKHSSSPDKTRLHLRNGYLFIVSLFFYFKTSGLFVLLLILNTLMGHWLGKRMDTLKTTTDRVWRRKALMITGVTINLLVLCYFKYAYFFTDICNNMFHSDIHVVNHLAQFANHFTDEPRFNAGLILLPVGISFFTFQNISYIVDVYKQKIAHVENLLDFGFYTTFFPQLVAGPIVRAEQFIPQLYKPYFLGKRQFGIALFWIVNGLMKKFILSNYLAVNFVDRVFEYPLRYTGFENLSALFIYSLQVYADFSGYTDIAIGVAMLMGFYLPKNFNSPYKATNPAGFWKRWHISLSNWLKDYLYIPLGGNRNGSWTGCIILAVMVVLIGIMAHCLWLALVFDGLILAVYFIFPRHRHEYFTNINNMDTMLLGGLWHGASFNFITWGGLNGLGILVYKWWKPQGGRTRVVATESLFALCLLADVIWHTPALNLAAVWSGIICFGTLIHYFAVNPLCNKYQLPNLKLKIVKIWNVLMTFVFITFTRLFFRSGSNLNFNPAEANEKAWNTAVQMVQRIGGEWDIHTIPAIIANYSIVFAVFVAGMAIHWLPDNFKRRYRLWFATRPLWMMAFLTVAAVFVIYQFVTADLQPFIYFQF